MGWGWLKDLVRREGTEMLVTWIDEQRMPRREAGYALQVRLTDMHLGRSRDWGRDRLPLFQSAITTPLGIEVPMTIGPSAFQAVGEERFVWAEQTDLPLTGLVPFDDRLGELGIVAGLLYVTGQGLLSSAAAFLGRLSALTHVPQLSAAKEIADKVADGAESLLGVVDSRGRAALQISVSSDNLQAGFLLVAGIDEAEFELDEFTVASGSNVLLYDGARASSLRGLDYFLLEMRVLDDSGESWRRITTINDPFEAALNLLGDGDDPKKLAESKAQLLVACRSAMTSDDLILGDRRRVTDLLKSRWSEARDSLGLFVAEAEDRESSIDVAIATL